MNRNSLVLLALALVLAAGSASCRDFIEAPYLPYVERDPSGPADLIEVSYSLADDINLQVNAPLSRYERVTVERFVNVDDPSQPTTLGRMLGRHVASRLAQHGFWILESTDWPASPPVGKDPGTFILGPQDSGLNSSRSLTGSYGLGEDGVLINARLLDAANGQVLGSSDRRLLLPYGDPLLQ